MALTRLQPFNLANAANYTFGSLTASGNVNAGNANLGNTVTANFFVGSGNNLSNIQAANITGSIANATHAATANTVTTNAQPNITSVGTLTDLTVSGVSNLGAIGNVIITGGSSGQVLSTNGSGNLSWISVSTSGISNGNSNVNIATANGNITMSVTGNANIMTVTGTGVNIAGTLSVSGNIDAGGGTGGNISGANYVQANYLTGYITTNLQPNITLVGTLSNLTVTGNVTAANIVGAFANGNSNVSIPAANGNVNISAVGNANILVVTGTGANISGYANVTGNLSAGNISASLLTGTLTTASQPNITSVGTLGSLAVTGNVTAGNITGSFANGNSNVSIPAANGNILFAVTGNANIASISGVGISVGLGSLTRTNVAANTALFAVSNVSSDAPPIIIQNRFATGYSSMDIISSSNLFMGAVGAANPSATSVAALANSAYLYGAANAAGVGVYATTGNVSISAASNANILVVTGTGVNVAGTLNATGNSILGNSLILSGTSNTTSFGQALTVRSSTGNNTSVMGIMNEVSNAYSSLLFFNNSGAEVGAIAFGNPTSVYYSNTMYIYSPNTTNGIVLSANIGSAPGNKNLWITNAGLVTVPGSTAATSTTTGAFQVTGGAGIGGNVYIGGSLSVTGVSNLGPVANVVITGGSNGQVLTTNGSGGLSWTTAAGGGASISNGNSNVNIATANGNVTISAAGNANVITVTSTGANVAGTANVTGNIAGGGELNISGNAVFGGNLTVDGSLVYVNVTDLSVEDPIIQLQTGPNGAAPTSNSGKDVGTALNYYDTAAKIAWMGWDTSNAEIAFGSNVSIASEVITFNTLANIRAGNAHLGNLVQANFFSGTLTTASQPNITSVGILSSLTATGNVVAGNVYANTGTVGASLLSGTLTTAAQPNVTSLGTLTGLTVSGTSNLGAVGNVVITGGSNGQVLTTNGTGGLSWTTVSGGGGGGANIANGDSNVSIATANGNVTVGVAGNANVVTFTGTGVNVAGTLQVSGVSNLGPVGNVRVTGGTNGQYLQTDGAGNLSWGSISNVSAVSDTFTGNGVQTTFTLSTTPANINLTYVNYNGALLQRSSYSLSGANLVFSSAPANNSAIEVTTMTGSIGSGGVAYSRTNATATASQTTFNVVYTPGYIQVYYNGVLLAPSDYTATNGTTVVLADPATAGDLVEFVSFTTTTTAVAQPATLNSTTLNSNLAITAGYSAVSAGPITIADGVSVTIASGQKWVIL